MLLCRILKGMRIRRPPKARYSVLWDVNIMLSLFLQWPTNRYLEIKRLTEKLACMLCLGLPVLWYLFFYHFRLYLSILMLGFVEKLG